MFGDRSAKRRRFEHWASFAHVINRGPHVRVDDDQPALRLLAHDLAPYRDELVISTKAGYDMLPGPYGQLGSRKHLLSSLDQSLQRMGLDYADIFYSHRFDPDTPLEETMGALDSAVRQGKALYVGISSYSRDRTRQAAAILDGLGTRLTIHQPSYSMLNRWIEDGLLATLEDLGGVPPVRARLATTRCPPIC